MNSGVWYVRQFGKVEGPYSWEQLRTKKVQGQLPTFAELSQDQMNWVSVSHFPEFAPPPPVPKRRSVPANPQPAGGATMAGVPAGSTLMGQVEPPTNTQSGMGTTQPPTVPWQGVPSAATWYYAVEEQQYGPVTLEQLQQLAAHGDLVASDMVWEQGRPDWVPLGEVLGLSGAVPKKSSPWMWLIPIGCLAMLFLFLGVIVFLVVAANKGWLK
jgi:hypothetical protein